MLAAELEVAFILFRDIGHRKGGHWNVHAFLVFDVVVILGFDDDLLGFLVLLDDFHDEVAIIDKNRIAYFDIAIESFISAIKLFGGTRHRGFGDAHDLAFFDRHAAIFHIPSADFRTFGIESDGDKNPIFAFELTSNLELSQLTIISAMRKINAHDIHAGVIKLKNHLGGVRGRPDGANDFGFL